MEDKSGLYIVAIVGLIAVVALVVLVIGGSTKASVMSSADSSATNTAGQVYKMDAGEEYCYCSASAANSGARCYFKKGSSVPSCDSCCNLK
jgi:hypothetical protein